MTDTRPIADISYWQGNNYAEKPNDPGVDFDKLVAKTSGVILRAGHGMAEDLRFRQYVEGLKNAGSSPIGAYWYILEDADPEHQAAAFADVIEGVDFRPYWLAGDTLLPVLWLDCEDNNAGKSRAYMVEHYGCFLRQLLQLVPWYASRIGIYTRASFWDYYVGTDDLNWPPLWVAHYGTTTPKIPAAWDGQYFLHQYSADGNGLGAEYGVKSRDIDLNRINPELLATDPPAPPEPEPVECVWFVKATANVYMRNYPNTNSRWLPSGGYVRTVAAGELLTAYERVPNVAGYDWLLVKDAANRAGWVAEKFTKAV